LQERGIIICRPQDKKGTRKQKLGRGKKKKREKLDGNKKMKETTYLNRLTRDKKPRMARDHNLEITIRKPLRK